MKRQKIYEFDIDAPLTDERREALEANIEKNAGLSRSRSNMAGRRTPTSSTS
ncbi:hypothetical protein [Chenggangzhangella methanolivorans]|uniref:hypothetical protein n=1 Tax=Chenggangzhangella methanolivorans TaxID=1437009 RepID=UPI0021BD4A80|nr:hypothetical protein [Chenggangzhangella methanolivorans]